MAERIIASDDFNRIAIDTSATISAGQAHWVSNGADMPFLRYSSTEYGLLYDSPVVVLGTGSGGGPDCGAVWDQDPGTLTRPFARMRFISTVSGNSSQSGPCVFSAGHLPFTKSGYVVGVGGDVITHLEGAWLYRINGGVATVLATLTSVPRLTSVALFAEVMAYSVELQVTYDDVVVATYSDTNASRLTTGRYGMLSVLSDGVEVQYWDDFEGGSWTHGVATAGSVGSLELPEPLVSANPGHWRLRHEQHPRRRAIAAAAQNRTENSMTGTIPVRYGYHALIERASARRDAIAAAIERRNV